MSNFKKKGSKGPPGITTASLPDIVFMLLFFFMVVTKMRSSEIMVKIQVPVATELQKLEKKSLVTHIYIGSPINKYQNKRGTAPYIQLNGQFAMVSEVGPFVTNERNKVKEKLRDLMTCAMRVDKEVKMGIITDVKTELRKKDFRKVSYLATNLEEH
jgi:biopolymer transport protein ExbD